MSNAVRIAVGQVIEDLQSRPSDFRCGRLTLSDSKTGLEYWVGNMACDAGVHKPYQMKFGWWHGWRFHRALTKWKAADVVRRGSAAQAGGA